MNTHVAADSPRARARRSARAVTVRLLGPAAMLAGLAWGVLQPWRVTLLHPRGQDFWWLVTEPPLLVVVVGAVFALFVAPGLVDDLEDAR